MKAFVVEIDEKYIILLKKDGEFVKYPITNSIAKSEIKVGYELDISMFEKKLKYERNKTTIGAIKKIASIAAVFLIIICFGYGVDSYYKPYAYVSIDINPSVEVTSNIFNRVINVEGINEEGNEIIFDDKFLNLNLENGIKKIIENAIMLGYIKPNYENILFLSVSSKNVNRVAEIEDSIQKFIINELDTGNIMTEIYIEEASVEEHNAASNLGISQGKYVLIEKLKEADPDVLYEEWINKPVKEIIAAINEKKQNLRPVDKAIKTKEKETKTPDTKEDNKIKKNNNKPMEKEEKIEEKIEEKESKILDKEKTEEIKALQKEEVKEIKEKEETEEIKTSEKEEMKEIKEKEETKEIKATEKEEKKESKESEKEKIKGDTVQKRNAIQEEKGLEKQRILLETTQRKNKDKS